MDYEKMYYRLMAKMEDIIQQLIDVQIEMEACILQEAVKPTLCIVKRERNEKDT